VKESTWDLDDLAFFNILHSYLVGFHKHRRVVALDQYYFFAVLPRINIHATAMRFAPALRRIGSA
jgi:hypothetical protein